MKIRTAKDSSPLRINPFSSAFCGCAFLLIAVPASESAAQTVDTSEWVCEFCPFETGTRGDYEVGASYVSDDSAYFGDATGYDEEGAYALVNGSGGFSGDASRADWKLSDLGVDSRAATLRGAYAGSFNYELDYREIPRRQFNSTSTIFSNSGGELTLPPGWVSAATTTGFTTLDDDLRARNIESDRTIYGLGADYHPSQSWTIAAAFRRQEQTGNKIMGGSYFTNSASLPVQIDRTTDEVDIGLRYADNGFTLALNWYLSEFDNGNTGYGWQHPFTTVAGAETAELAAAPDSRFQQLAFSAGYGFATFDTYVVMSAAIGEIEQTEPLLAYTRNANLTTSALPRRDLAGSIETTRYAFSLTSKPTRKSRVRVSYNFDERDNKTAQALWNRVIADSFISNDPQLNIPYSFERSTLRASAEYKLLKALRISAGYDRVDKDFDFQEIDEQTEETGWGRVRWRPLDTIDVDIRGGAGKRDIDSYNEMFAQALGQNPLMRKYNLAYRYRNFGELTVTYSPATAPLTLSLTGMRTDDEYSKSQIGLTSGDELRFGADLSWQTAENTTIYLNVGSEDISSTQFGGAAGAPTWRADYDDDFTTIGAGFVMRNVAEKFDLFLDYSHSDGSSEIEVDSTTAPDDQFPDLTNEMDNIQFRLSYNQSERLGINLNLRYQSLSSDDWALEGVAPDTIPVVLALGATPYDPEVFIVELGFRYRLGER